MKNKYMKSFMSDVHEKKGNPLCKTLSEKIYFILCVESSIQN